MFAAWCHTLPVHRLEQVRRFAEPWQADASRGLRAGEPAAVAAYAEHRRVHTVHPALLADRVARVTRADGVAVRWADATNQRFMLLAARGLPPAVLDGSRCLQAESCYCGAPSALKGVRIVPAEALARAAT